MNWHTSFFFCDFFVSMIRVQQLFETLLYLSIFLTGEDLLPASSSLHLCVCRQALLLFPFCPSYSLTVVPAAWMWRPHTSCIFTHRSVYCFLAQYTLLRQKSNHILQDMTGGTAVSPGGHWELHLSLQSSLQAPVWRLQLKFSIPSSQL